jgi:hypothetical protein
MTRSGSRAWAAFCVVGLALWIGATVVAAVLNDDAADPRPVLLTFAAGGAAFFGAMFGAALLQTRPRSDPELDALLTELAVHPAATRLRASLIERMRRIARAYIVLGILVTGLGLWAIVQEALETGDTGTTVTIIIAIVVAWALAVPFVIRFANRASASVLAPLGLTQRGAALIGERHGRRVRIDITATGSVTRLRAETGAAPMAGEEIHAHVARGAADTWKGVAVETENDQIVVRRDGHAGPSWLWDVWLAEQLGAEEAPG